MNITSLFVATTYHLAHDFVCHVLFRKSSHNHGLWNLDANCSLEEPHGGIDLFLLRRTILWHVGNGPYIVLQQLWIWNCDDNAILHVTRREMWNLSLLDKSSVAYGAILKGKTSSHGDSHKDWCDRHNELYNWRYCIGPSDIINTSIIVLYYIVGT